jgi:nucleotide-binding universal stress UspA family protein
MQNGFKRVMLPVDFSEHCDQAAQYAAWFAKVSGGTVHLVHVVANPADPLYAPEEVPHWVMVEHAEAKAKEMLEASARLCLPLDCPRRFHVLSGDPYEKLMEAGASIKADVIVMSTHGRGGVVNLVMGNVAEKLVRQAPCPIFVVRHAAA